MKTFVLVTLVSALALSAISAEAFSFHPLHPLQALQSFTSNQPAALPHKPSELATALKDYFLAFQKAMPCGGEGFPVLAPFTMDYQELNYSSEYYSVQGYVSGIQVSGLNNFQILKLDYSNDYVSYDIYFPLIQLLGEFNVTMKFKMLGFWATDLADCLTNLKWKGFRYVGSYKMAPINPGVNNNLEISDYKLQTLAEGFEVHGWNYEYDALVNNFRNKMFGELGALVLQETQGLVQSLTNEYYVPMLNEIYNTITLQQLTDYIMQGALAMQNTC